MEGSALLARWPLVSSRVIGHMQLLHIVDEIYLFFVAISHGIFLILVVKVIPANCGVYPYYN